MQSNVNLSNRFFHFLASQAEGIHRRGFSAVRHKTVRVFGLAAAVPLVLLVRLISPLYLIRFSGLNASRIGHVTSDVEFYLCEKEAGLHPRSLDLFYYRGPICNAQLGRMIERKIRVFNWLSNVNRINRFLPGGGRHTIRVNEGLSSDHDGVLARWPIHLGLNQEEERFGEAALESMGLPVDAPFVCFHIRDSAYLSGEFPDDFNHHYHKDSKAQNYLPAMEELTEKGYFVFRMGSSVNERLNISNPKIIDYASNHRTDFLDLYLFWKCSFYLGSTGGIYAVPAIFRKPIAYVNYPPVQFVGSHRSSSGPKDLLIHKRLWLRREQRFMTFAEILESGAAWFRRGEEYEHLGIDPIENTPEEITALALEMDQRLRGTWDSTVEDEELQSRFESVFKPDKPNGIIAPRIGAQYLRENRALLN